MCLSVSSGYFFFKKMVFIYIWLCWVFTAARAFCSCGEQGTCPLVVVVRLPRCRAGALGRLGFKSRSAYPLEQAQSL